MSEIEWQDEEEFSLFALATTLLRDRWRIAGWMFLGALIAAATVFAKPALYKATASFTTQASESNRSGLSSLAGQFGVSLPTSGQAESPELYSTILRSRVVLEPILLDTLVVPEMGGRKVPLLDLLEIHDPLSARRIERGVTALQAAIEPSVARTTGVVQITVITKWQSVSLAIATALIDGVNRYNQRTRQSQAAAEARFVEDRLALSSSELRGAEDRLQQFLTVNRTYIGSPQLEFQHDRLQRDVQLRQQVYTSLMQSYEDVRMREVRDTPVISIVEPPSVRTEPEPRGRLKSAILGLLLGGLIGVGIAVVRLLTTDGRKAGDPHAEEFFRNVREIRSGIASRFGRGRPRAQP